MAQGVSNSRPVIVGAPRDVSRPLIVGSLYGKDAEQAPKAPQERRTTATKDTFEPATPKAAAVVPGASILTN